MAGLKRWRVKRGSSFGSCYVFKLRKGESYGPGEEFMATEEEVEPQRAKVEEVLPDLVKVAPTVPPRRKERAKAAALREPPADRAVEAP